MMQNVAFLRNVNQGQRGHPSTVDLLAALVESGASDVFAFRSNGTLVFDADDPVGVAERLRAAVALGGREVFVRPSELVESMLQLEGMHGVQGLEVTLFDSATDLSQLEGLESAMALGHCEIVESAPGWALIYNRIDRRSNGTPVAEFVIGGPATSRSLATMVALARRLDAR